MSVNTLFIPKENFDWEYYLVRNPDLKQTGLITMDKCYRHWIVYGCYENRWVKTRDTGEERQIKLRSTEKFVIPKEPELLCRSVDLHFKIAIMIHVYDVGRMMPFFVSYLNGLSHRYVSTNFDIYFNIVQENSPYQGDLKQYVSGYLQQIQFPQVSCHYQENRGGDIGGLLQLSKTVVNSGIDYRYAIFVHSKKKNQWRIDLCRCIFNLQFEQLTKNPDWGLMSAKKWIYHFDPSKQPEELCRFRYHLIDLCHIYQLPMDQPWQFVAGTMFLTKIEILRYIVSHQIEIVYQMLNRVNTVDVNWLSIVEKLQKDAKGTCNDFQYRLRYGRPLLSDYMIEHTYERILGLICQHLGWKVTGM